MAIQFLIVATTAELNAETIVDLFKEENIFQIHFYTLSVNHVVIGIRRWFNSEHAMMIYDEIDMSTKEEVVSLEFQGQMLDVVDLEKHYAAVCDFLEDMGDLNETCIAEHQKTANTMCTLLVFDKENLQSDYICPLFYN